mmetsp:Transcript_53447/g.106300  ORF Transcript_53447/g.106300 Transcript_53447/m.106300 type:complete len:284 (-) Transcript_53447:275-1126(-)
MERTFGIRVEPPTSTTSLTSDFSTPASSSTFSTGTIVWRNRSAQSSSNLARVTVSERSSPGSSDSISTRTSGDELRARLARSASRRSFWRAAGVLSGSLSGCFFFNSPTRCLISLLSRSSPPRCVSPAVANTSKTPESIESSDTSKVPPPRSNTNTVSACDALRSNPKAMAAAVGSLRIRITLRPAMAPASLVACRCASLKYAGTVTTMLTTFFPRAVSAVSRILPRIMADTSCGVSVLVPSCVLTWKAGLPPASSMILNGHIFMSFFTCSSENLRPISRLAS